MLVQRITALSEQLKQGSPSLARRKALEEQLARTQNERLRLNGYKPSVPKERTKAPPLAESSPAQPTGTCQGLSFELLKVTEQCRELQQRVARSSEYDSAAAAHLRRPLAELNERAKLFQADRAELPPDNSHTPPNHAEPTPKLEDEATEEGPDPDNGERAEAGDPDQDAELIAMRQERLAQEAKQEARLKTAAEQLSRSFPEFTRPVTSPFRLELLAEHDRTGFECGEPALDGYYREFADAGPATAQKKADGHAGLDLIRGSEELYKVDRVCAGEPGADQVFARAFATLPERWDDVIIDPPPARGLVTYSGLSAAQVAIVVVSAQYLPLKQTTKVVQMLEKVRDNLNPNLREIRYLVNQVDTRIRSSIEVADTLRKHLGEAVFETAIRLNCRLSEAPSHGVPVVEYDARSNGAVDFIALAKEFAPAKSRKPSRAEEGAYASA